MSGTVIYANENLVVSGDFVTLEGWHYQGYVDISRETYQDLPINVLEATNEGYAEQIISIPRSQGNDAHYTLSFLCEVAHEQPGWLRIFKGEGDGEELCSIELKPASARKQGQSPATAGQPLVFNPIAYELKLDLPLEQNEKIKIRIVSPKNAPSDFISNLRITRIKLLLELAPLKLASMQFDEQTVAPDSTLYLCLGTTSLGQAHRLTFVPEPGNAWIGTDCSLTANGNPLEAVTAAPDWGVNQALSENWLIDCPWIDDQRRYEFELSLHNRYTAEAYRIPVSLGHHRLGFTNEQEAAYYPVFEYAQSVDLGVQVVSYYTGQPVAGQTVNWTVEGSGVQAAVVSQDDGWCGYTFVPEAAGDFVLTASVASPYYASGVVTREFQVKVLQSDPWKALNTVVGDERTPWETQGYPNRGSAHEIRLDVPTGSPFAGTTLKLYAAGDSLDQLGVDVSPDLENPVPVDDGAPLWTLTSADQLDGLFQLSLACSKLKLRSPLKPMSLARNRVKVGRTFEANKSPVVDEQESVLLRVQVLHATDSGAGEPVINAYVDWHTPERVVQSRTGAGGWASLLYTPAAAGELTVTAKIKAYPEADSIDQAFAVNAIASSPWKSAVRILLDNKPVELSSLGMLCRRGQSHVLKVEPISDAWVGKNISLHWRGVAPPIGLVPSDLGVPKALVTDGVLWTLESGAGAESVSSLFDLQLRIDGVEIVQALSGRLLSVDLHDEVKLMLDQVSAALDDQVLYPCLGTRHRFKVLPNELSPLVGLEVACEWSGDSAEELEASVEPKLHLPQVLDDGGAVWTLDFSRSERPGRFALTLALPQLEFRAHAKPMALNHNKVRIHILQESALDPVVGQQSQPLWAQICSHFTGRPVSGVTVEWWADDHGSDERTDDEGWSRFAFTPTTAGTYTVIAMVTSLFDDHNESRDITVKALASDPWDDLMVSFEGHPVRWGEKTCFPRRTGTYTLSVKAKSGSELLKHQIALGMTGTGPEQLNMRFLEPGLGKPLPFSEAGFDYQFMVNAENDGSFGLCFASDRLANLSPVNAMSLGEGEQVVKIAERLRVKQTLLWGDEVSEQITIVSAVTGKPMADVVVTWRSPDLGEMTATTNFYGVASVRFVPSTAGAFELNAAVGGTQYSESIALPFYLNEPCEIRSLQSDEPSGHPGAEVAAQVVVVSARTGEPLADVEVAWEYPGIKIASTKTDDTGKSGVKFRLPPIKEGWLRAFVKGGYAGWEVRSMKFTAIPNADTWLQEFTLWLNGEEVDLAGGELKILRGVSNELELRVRPHSWLIPWAELALEDHSETEPAGLGFSPELGVSRKLDGSPVRWSVWTDPSSSDAFTLKFTSQTLPDHLLKGQIIDFDASAELEVSFDTFAESFGSNVYPCLGATHTIRVKAKSGSRLIGSQVKLGWEGASAESLGIVLTPALDVEQLLDKEELVWTLDCKDGTRNDVFSLTLNKADHQWATKPLAMSLGHNSVTAKRGFDQNYNVVTITATSTFLNVPASGVFVSVFWQGGSDYIYTQENGVATYPAGTQLREFRINNLYDGTQILL